MASQIIRLDACRPITTTSRALTVCATLPAERGTDVASRARTSSACHAVAQVPTKANKQQRCKTAAVMSHAECENAMSQAQERLDSGLVTGAMLVTSTDLNGGDFNVRLAGIYAADPAAGLATLECLAQYFTDMARDARNACAMTHALPVKRPAFEVAL